jgi:ornithine cyclodeaminase/alanine dehydrogenase-like protein (mu-crystallin family)
MTVPWVSAAEVLARVPPSAAIDALHAALVDGLDPDAEPARAIVPLADDHQQLLVMPSSAMGWATVKLVTIGGEPRIQGLCVVFDRHSLAPVAIIDGIALTTVRTAAVSALAARELALPTARRLLVFGRGPQAQAHVAALSAVLPIEVVDLVGREHGAADNLVAAADVICCCTTARASLFDGALVRDDATVIAIGSHEPAARETDDALAARATVVVESRTSALREAGDVIGAIASGALDERAIVSLAEVVRGAVTVAPDRPRLFKSTGMAWEDAVVGSLVATSAVDTTTDVPSRRCALPK